MRKMTIAAARLFAQKYADGPFSYLRTGHFTQPVYINRRITAVQFGFIHRLSGNDEFVFFQVPPVEYDKLRKNDVDYVEVM